MNARVWLQRIPSFLFATICLLAIADIARSYPDYFYPRFWDEAIYAWDVGSGGGLLGEHVPGQARFAPMKLGYGLPLGAAFRLFGANGLMYLSTCCWLATILVVGITVTRRFGAVAGFLAAAFLSSSSLYGKYVVEVDPTLLAALVLCLLWVVYPWRRFWLTGLVLGYLAFVDLKWLLPVALSVLVIETLAECSRPRWERIRFISGVACVTGAVLAIASIIHPPYRDYVVGYVARHAPIIGYAPSAVFLYFLVMFGAAPILVAAALTCLVPAVRRQLILTGGRSRLSLLHSLALAGVPLLYHSLFGELKGLRFFAVPFSLLSVPVAAVLGGGLSAVNQSTESRSLPARFVSSIVSAVAIIVLLVSGLEGPARHLRLPAGITDAMTQLSQKYGRSGRISSYIWPVVHYGWGGTGQRPPFAPWGLEPNDRWLMLNPALDRVTVEGRMRLEHDSREPESVWRFERDVFTSVSDSLFSVPADFYSSDYYLSEQVVGGVPVMRRWREFTSLYGNQSTVYQIDQGRLRKRFGG